MTTNVFLAPPPILQFLNNAGQPNAGGSVLTQVGGVNYPTYQDSAGTVPLPNPIPLNSRGEVSNSSGVSSQLFLASGVTYVFTLFDANNNQISQAQWVSSSGILQSDYVGNLNRVVDSISALRSLSHSAYTRAFVTGYYGAGDGGGGPYWYDPSDTTSADNGGTIIVATDGGRWKLQKIDWVSCKQFGAKGDSATDDTTALQNWLNIGGNLWAPAGNYKITAALKWAVDNTWIQGAGRNSTIFNFNFAGASAFLSSTQGTTERYYCRASDIQFLDNGGVGRILDLKDMQFCYLERCFTFGKGAAGSIGIYMASTNTTLQCTYNAIRDHYNGNTQYGIYMTDGANANLIEGGRFQSPVASAIGIILTATALNNVNSNTILGVGIEQPGNTLIGIQCNGNTSGTTIISPRLEQLLTGIVIQATDIGVAIFNAYYDSCTTNINDVSGKAAQVGLGKFVGHIQPSVSFNYNGNTSTTNSTVGCSVSRAATGQYQINITAGIFSASASMIPLVNTDAFMTRVVLISATSVQVFTYNASGVAVDANIYGSVLG